VTTTGLRVRPAAVAGLFYPADAGQLRGAVEGAMAAAVRSGPVAETPPKAVIAPHAGYVYSGPIAASAYAQLAPGRGLIQRVVLLGPAHRVPLTAVATSSADTWATPLGRLEVDRAARDRLLSLPDVVVDDTAHRFEHSLEVHLPFLQVVLGHVAVLPLVAGRVAAQAVARVLEQVWGGPETAIVVSTDLSHYHDHDTAVRLDRATAEAIVARRPEGVGPDRACGVYAVRGLLVVAERKELDVRLLDLRTSGDTAGARDRVVGYGAFALAQDGPDGAAELGPGDAAILLDLAEDAIRAGLAEKVAAASDPRRPDLPPALLAASGVFVTIEVDGALNGCIGTVEPVEPMATAVPRLAAGAAFQDPRLPPLSADDWPGLRIKISLLSRLRPLPAATEADVVSGLRVGIDGLVLAQGGRRATFLPTMWRMLPEPADFVRHLLGKAGIPGGTWLAGMQAWTYTTVELNRSVTSEAGQP
jgi:AmmeMemoRadiSam system protein B/AmmeMemoRadiSam system protein A